MIRIPGFMLFLFFCTTRVLAVDAVMGHSLFYTPVKNRPGILIPDLEICWQINPGSLHYTTSPQGTFTARIKTELLFTNSLGTIKQDKFILTTVPRTSVKDIQSHSILELRKYALPPGFVKVKMVLTDLADSLHPFTLTDTFTIAPTPEIPFFSSLQLLDTILANPAETNFLRNGAQQVPSCSNFLDDFKRNLQYYAELYHTEKINDIDYPLIRSVCISHNDEIEESGEFVTRDTFKSSVSTINTGSFNITSLKSGNYYLVIMLTNRNNKLLAKQSLFIQRLNKHPYFKQVDSIKKPVSDTGLESVNVVNLKKTFIAKYTMGETKGILKMMLPFCDQTQTQTIKGFLKNPEEIYMRYFIYNYFLAINKRDPGKAFKEFTNKIIECNKRFSGHGTAGYESDRGFMYLRYGVPTEVITIENESGSLPYEIWQYNVLTQMNRKEVTNGIFLFYKQNQNLDDFRLLHSTIDGETKNFDWRNSLFTNGYNQESRAEEFIGKR